MRAALLVLTGLLLFAGPAAADLVAVTLDDDAEADAVAVSLHGRSRAGLLAASGTGDAEGVNYIAVAAVSGTGTARGAGLTASVLGDAVGDGYLRLVAVSVAGDASSGSVAASVLGDARADVPGGVAVSGWGAAEGDHAVRACDPPLDGACGVAAGAVPLR